jgi:FtsZ-binding cell division protein ZapB
MEKKRAIIMMIARYRADAVALEKREKDLLEQIEFIENLIPTVSISYMSRAIQAKRQMHPQAEVDEARERLEHLKQSLQELQQSVYMVRDEANIMNQRIIELEAMLIDQYPGGVSAIEGLNLFRLSFDDLKTEDKGKKREKKKEGKTQEANKVISDDKPKPDIPPSKEEADPIDKKERC